MENSNAYWYVTSEVADPKEELVLAEAAIETSVADLIAPLGGQEVVEENPCLIANR